MTSEDIKINPKSKDYLLKFPELYEKFNIFNKIGEGSFASVFLVSSKANPEIREKLALRFIVPFLEPKRILNELKILRKLDGKRNVIRLHLTMRIKDNIFMLMSYVNHKKFHEYYLLMDLSEIRLYMKNLLLALEYVHQNQIIHNDVKPSNFLYDRKRQKFSLIDFGLAHMEGEARLNESMDECSGLSRAGSDCSGNKLHRGFSSGGRLRMSGDGSGGQGSSGSGNCVCDGDDRVEVLMTCAGCRGRPCALGGGVQRGGTVGYRAPEVMMRLSQTGPAVDVWAAGMVLASFLTGRYPVLVAEDDLSALYQVVLLLGLEPLQETARKNDRCLAVVPIPPASLGSSLDHLRSRCEYMRLHCPRIAHSKEVPAHAANHCFPGTAFAMLLQLLAPDQLHRISCSVALRHPFLQTA